MIEQPNLDEVIAAWQRRTQRDSPLKLGPFCLQAIRQLAGGQPVAPEQFATAGQLSLTEVSAAFAALKRCGGEFDETGKLVGTILTLRPTLHHFRVNGHDLYAWCALDTLFLPALLQQPARVESTCPATGGSIRLSVTPEGVVAVDPPGAVLSIVIPGLTPSCDVGAVSGPQGPICSTMHFFASPEAAETWLVAHPGVAILAVAEAWRLALEVFIEPVRAYL